MTRRISLRFSVILLLLGTLLTAMAVVGTALLVTTIERIEESNLTRVQESSKDIAERLEFFLHDIENRVEIAAELFVAIPKDRVGEILASERRERLDALYVIDASGRLVSASLKGATRERERELAGIELSTYPLFTSAMERADVIWSDKHISAVTGAVTLGLARQTRYGSGVIIAEVSLDTVLQLSRLLRGPSQIDFWVVDRNGEIVADTSYMTIDQTNIRSLPVITSGFSGESQPTTLSLDGTRYAVAATYSRSLDWLVVSRVPTGIDDPGFRETVIIVATFVIGALLLGSLLATFWARSIARPLEALSRRAQSIAGGTYPEKWPSASIVEISSLYDSLQTMAEAIGIRESALQKLNEELEQRVTDRTAALQRSNLELSKTLNSLETARDELIQAEKLAALGRLVAGVAHELATPLGNGRMAISTLRERFLRFKQEITGGIRRSELESFILATDTSTEIAEANLRRASNLIGTFKQVAADRTVSRRRTFDLHDVIGEVLLTTTPSIKRKQIEVISNVPEQLRMDSFPGELGQVLTNLIENAALHAFTEGSGHVVDIDAVAIDETWIRITVSDNGAGMPEATARKAFDPFYTTLAGRGGTGLGLFITLNAVTNVLGGSITLDSKPGEGTRFEIVIPRVAPRDSEDGSET